MDTMEHLPVYKLDEEDVQMWLKMFSLWFRLEKKAKEDKASWCQIMIGPATYSILHLTEANATYNVMATTQWPNRGTPSPSNCCLPVGRPHQGLTLLQELAQQAKHLASWS